MQELRTTATFTNEQPDRDALTTIVARSVLEAALAEGESAELWFDLAGADEEVSRLSIDLGPTDMEQLLGLSSEDEIAMSLDGGAFASLFDDPDVEAHGLKCADRDRRLERRDTRPGGSGRRDARHRRGRDDPAHEPRRECSGSHGRQGRGHRRGNEGRGHRRQPRRPR